MCRRSTCSFQVCNTISRIENPVNFSRVKKGKELNFPFSEWPKEENSVLDGCFQFSSRNFWEFIFREIYRKKKIKRFRRVTTYKLVMSSHICPPENQNKFSGVYRIVFKNMHLLFSKKYSQNLHLGKLVSHSWKYSQKFSGIFLFPGFIILMPPRNFLKFHRTCLSFRELILLNHIFPGIYFASAC